MWYFTSDNDDRVIYIISQAQQIIIGRSAENQQCNFAIPNDPSISRKHATLTVKDNSLFLQDLGSKYGTFVNDTTDKVEINTDIKLNPNDIVKFGKMSSVWKVNVLAVNVCTSTLKGDHLQRLKQNLAQIGGTLKNEWDDTCNYLTMPNITLTIKVVLALVQGAHIVTPQYWINFLENINKFLPLPDPQNFIPDVVESTLNKEVVSFLPDKRRQMLFNDKKIIFFSRRQYEMYKQVLVKSGASPTLLSDCKLTVSTLSEPNIIVIQYAPTGSTQETNLQRSQINDVNTYLISKDKRVIADAEIGLAILYCSLEKYCNPSFSFTSEVVKQNAPVSKTSKVLAQESQESSIVRQDKSNVKINETYGSDDKCNFELNGDKQMAKRKLSDLTSEVDYNPNKKLATTYNKAETPNESTKRPLPDDDSSLNPSKKMTIDKENIDQGASNSTDDLFTGKSNEMFNFINEAQPETVNKTKKLNLSRPQKRKVDSTKDGDLFNFVQTDKESESDSSKQSMFTTNKIKKEEDAEVIRVKNNVTVTPEDISAMRGVKLKELIEKNKNTIEEFSVKQECDELGESMSRLDLGNTVVITCCNLIVKKEPLYAEADESLSTVKNFKKFKKVWPVRRQNIIVPVSTMDITNTAQSSDTYSAAF